MSFKEQVVHCKYNNNYSAGTSSNTEKLAYNEEVVILYICEKCGQGFQNKASFRSHNKRKHTSSNHVCSMCKKIFTRRNYLEKHQKNCQNIKKNKLCSLCDFRASSSAEVLRHYEVKHNVIISEKTLSFNTFEEFEIWKEEFERNTKSRFIRKTGTRHTVDGVNITKYICHRDGNFQSKSRGIRHMKAIGSDKINAYCPANIIVYETEQSVKITASERADIAQKLALKIPTKQILDEIHDSAINSELERVHLATRKDLWNIAKSYNLNNEAKQQSYKKRKQDVINKVVKVCNTIETEEQLEAVLKQVASLENIISALSKKHKTK
ncbi:zinc finger protein 432 isoform X2 [Agrilus planipennis]|uniref:Zinc finger protein 432 isoform X2 n=1 Tax=Agrilus planipennis TaxID=224129 RepID=A0A1W4WGE0_AGRPL|nr:zinc finger protein 432 isoform X2 [Agrilus planipennis]